MKKSYNPISDDRNDKVELTRRISRNINEIVKQLDDVRGRAQTVQDLFLPCVEIQRVKLQELCSRLIHCDPAGFGRKGEDLLWRKVYHDVLTTAKLFKKKDSWTGSEQGVVRSLLLCGVGHYQHLIMKLQVDYKLDLQGYLDFTLCMSDTDMGLNKGRAWMSQQKSPEKACKDWARESCHRCLIFLGDLHRYLIELDGTGWDCGTARRYYQQALYLIPGQGRPHNQLGTLAGCSNYNLDAAFHYALCLVSPEPFSGAESNLLKTLDRNNELLQMEPYQPSLPSPVQRLVTKVLHLFESWYFDRALDRDMGAGCREAVEALHCCSITEPGDYAGAALDVFEPEIENLQPFNVGTKEKLTGDVILKMLTLLVLAFDKHNKKDAVQASSVSSVTLAIVSYCLQHLVTRLQDTSKEETVIEQAGKTGKGKVELNGHGGKDKTLGEKEVQKNGIHDTKKKNQKKDRLSRLKRRKKIRRAHVECDISDSEGSCGSDGVEDSSSDDNASNASEDDCASSGSDEGDEDRTERETNGVKANGEAKKLNGVLEKVKKDVEKVKGDEQKVTVAGPPSAGSVVHLLTEQTTAGVLSAVSVWLRSEHVRIMMMSCKALLTKLVIFLNCLQPQDKGSTRLESLLRDANKIPLTEDTTLRGLAVLKESQSDMNWEYHRNKWLTPSDEAAVRVHRLMTLGRQLSRDQESGLKFDKTLQTLYVVGDNGKKEKSFGQEGRATRKGQLMKNMGQLWLKAEVRDLESRVRGRGGNFSPYLVVDSDALIEHIVLVKQLVGSRQFIVIIPAVVVSHLDECKRDSGRARETIRWLESQFQHGNRSLRAQKSQERFPLPLIKYPKKKDKEAWNFFQIMECCYYFSKQSEFESCRSTLLVTLLTGQKRDAGQVKEESKDFSPLGIARNCAINLDHIEAFHTKWKLSSKSHG